jgi:hypothetical protein
MRPMGPMPDGTKATENWLHGALEDRIARRTHRTLRTHQVMLLLSERPLALWAL